LVAVSSTTDWAFLEYLRAAFSEEDERSIQAVYLIEAFKEHPLLGSGFGGYAGYTRSAEMPWLYELTYYQILFNLGLAGAAMLLAGLAYFSHLALNTLRRADSSLPVSCGILVGFFTILIGSYSNPYMQFFDSMVFTMLFVSLSGAAGPVLHLRRGSWPQVAPAS
jgi:O-antigen ligase